MPSDTSGIRQELYRTQDEFQRSLESYKKENIEAELRAGKYDGKEKVLISLDSLSPLPKCPKCGAKKTGRAKKCRECGFRF